MTNPPLDTWTSGEQPVSPDPIMKYAWGFAPPLMLNAALKFGVFDALEQGPQDAQALAQATGADPRALRSVCNGLVGMDVLEKNPQGQYENTPHSSAFLVSSKPSYHGGLIQHVTTQAMKGWLELSSVLGSGQPANRVDHQSQGPAFFEPFVESLFPLSRPAAQALGRHLGVPQTDVNLSVLDIAAGSGVWGITLAEQSPLVKVTAQDWPKVLEVTKQIAQRQGVADRLTTAPGDLMEADFGSGHHIATLGHILHSEGEPRSRQLLAKLSQAIEPGGTVAIAEFLVNADRRGPLTSLIFAVNMLVHTQEGDTFSFEQISDWLQEAGFERPRLLEVPGPSPLVLADKPL